MGSGVPVKNAPALNPCCTVWKERCSKLEEGRKCLRQAVKLLTEQDDKIKAENVSLKKEYEEEKARAATEKAGKEKEAAVRVCLEDEISALKSEISSLKQKGSEYDDKIGELKCLQDRVAEDEKLIKQLKEHLEAQKKSAAEAWKHMKAEKAKADEERKHANNEGNKAEEYRLQLEELKKEADEAKSELASEALRFEEANRKLQAEKHRMTTERKHTNLEMSRAEDQCKLAEGNGKRVMEEQSHAESLCRQLDDARRRIEELQKAEEKLVSLKKEADETKSKLASKTSEFEEAKRKLEAEKHKVTGERKPADSEMGKAEEQRKLAEANGKMVMEERSRTENLSCQLEDARQRIKEAHETDKYWVQFEALKKEAGETKSKLVSETLKLEEVNKRLEAEKHKVTKERKHAHSEMAKAEEQRKLAKANGKKVMEERSRAENLSWQLDDARRRIEEAHKTDEYWVQFEALKKEADKTKSKLVSVTLRLEDANKRLEAEKHKVTEEGKRANSEMAKAEEQRKLAEANGKKVMEERYRAEQLSKQLEDARQKIDELQKEINEFIFSKNSSKAFGDQWDDNSIDEATDTRYRLWLENLKDNVDQSKLVSEVLKSVEATKRFEVEKQKAMIEKKHADSELVKAEEQGKLVELNRKMVMEEKSPADQLSHQHEEDRLKIEELQRQIQELMSSGKLLGSSSILCEKDMKAEPTKLKLLKKQLKLEKMQLKRTKHVAKLEKWRNNILLQELGRLKLDFSQISGRLDVLDKCFPPSAEGADDMEKVQDNANQHRPKLKRKLCGSEPVQMYPQDERELLQPSCMATADSDSLRQTLHCIAPLLPISRRNYAESMSGIDSKLESLLGGSNRKSLQSSAINSSSASFSDGQLIGSQERDAFVTTSEKMAEGNFNAQPTIASLSGEVNKMQHNENLAMTAENSVRSPCSIHVVGRVNGHSRKGRTMLDAIESVEFLYSEGKKLNLQMEEKLSALHGILNRQIDKPLEESKYMDPNMQGGSYAMHKGFHKKTMVSHEEKIIMQHLSNIDEPVKTQKVGNEVLDDTNACRWASNIPNNLIGNLQSCGEGLSNSFQSDLETTANLEGVVNGDYMKLLDLDDTSDEECYRRAMERPLSPTLPEIGFPSAEICDVDNLEPLIDESVLRGLPNENEVLVPSHSFDAIDVEISSNKLKNNAARTSSNESPYRNECPVDSVNRVGNRNGFGTTVEAEKFSQNRDSGMELETSNIPCSGVEGLKFPSEGALGVAHENIPKFCVIFSNVNDGRSISRIFCATRSCMARCTLDTQTEQMVQKILQALKIEEKILPKEKACVFFTLLLLNFSMYTCGNSGSFMGTNSVPCLESFARNVNAAMTDLEARNLFAELCHLDELLGLIEDFLMGGRVIYADLSSVSLSECDSRISILLDGVNIKFSSKSASADQLVAGSIILASICAAIDYIGFICEAAYSLLRMHRCDTSALLTILHVFALLGGEKFFSMEKYNLTMTVVKSIVIFVERVNSSVASVSCLSSLDEVRIFPCVKCPFSRDAVSIDIVTSELLEKLQSCALSGTMCQHLLESANLSNSSALCHNDIAKQSLCHEEVHSVFDVNCDACFSLTKFVVPVTQADNVINQTMWDLSDLLSLVELLACNMSWEWTYGKIIPELLEMLARAKLDNFAVAVVVLLGQLGRIGVVACGYEDKGVEKLRSKLSSYLCCETANAIFRAALPVQIAIVTALLGLLPLDFEEVVQNNLKLPVPTSQSVFIDLIRNWFSSLGQEQQALSFSLLRSADVVKK